MIVSPIKALQLIYETDLFCHISNDYFNLENRMLTTTTNGPNSGLCPRLLWVRRNPGLPGSGALEWRHR